MKKILLTGGNGFFCSRFANQYKDTYNILSIKRADLDVTDEKKVLSVFEDFRPDYVIHAAAIASTAFCNNNPEKAHTVNVIGSLNIAKACKKTNSKLVFLSSEQVFNGNIESGPYKETDIPKPDTVYGQNKLEAEQLLQELLDEVWILRFTWLFGLPERNCGMSPNILWSTLSSIIENKQISASTDEYRGLTYVYDVIDQFPKIFEIPYGIYHIGSQNNYSRYDSCALIFKELNIENRVNELLIKDTKKYKDHPRDIRLCTEKIQEFKITFEDTDISMKKCLSEFKI